MKKRYFNMIPSPDTACILLYGEIGGFDGISDKDIVAELYEYASMYKSIDIRVNSPGGSVYAGMSIFNALRSSEADITIMSTELPPVWPASLPCAESLSI